MLHRYISVTSLKKLPKLKSHWHFFSELGKKLNAMAARTGFEMVGRWRKSKTNHLHRWAASTPSGGENLMLAKWNSLPNHITNIHQGHSVEFPACQPEVIHQNSVEDQEWFDPGNRFSCFRQFCQNNFMVQYSPITSYNRETLKLCFTKYKMC